MGAERRTRAGAGSAARSPLRWGVALSLTTALVLGLAHGFLQANVAELAVPVPSLVLALTGAGVVGFLAALSARLILEGWTGALRFLLSLLSLLIWMVASEVTEAVWRGVHPSDYVAGADDWVETGQLAIGCLSALSASLIARRSREPGRSRRAPTSAGAAAEHTSTRASLKGGLGLSLAVAVIVGLGLGSLQANASRLAVSVPPLVLDLVAAGITGLLAGLIAHLLLRGWTEALRFLVVLLTLLIWTVVAEGMYAVWVGFRLPEYLAGADNWVEMGQLAIGCLGAVVGGLARRRVSSPELALPAQTGDASTSTATPHRASRQARPGTSVRRRPVLSLPRLRLPVGRRRWHRPTGQNAGVKVVAKAEDRCPYCLDVIEKRDPRGVVVCDICGTPHHRDCWEAGGKCQVPHLIT